MLTKSLLRTRNLPLLFGTLLVGLLVGVAIFGPQLAPHDPMLREVVVVRNDGQVYVSPLPPFVSADYPLGMDNFNRDMLSRLLHAVRPTLLLVCLVGAIRLLIGAIIGAAAGWSRGIVGLVANRLIDGAIALPVLVVALAVIALVGIERGLIAFIFGMALTGWADTAQSIRAQAARIRNQPYIEAAEAMGGSGIYLVLRHLLRHLTPMMAVLLAFEISATLMLTAGLGFLGYYIGGGVWIILDGDLIPNATRAAGPPELGQMIATAVVRFSSRPPWQMIFPGVVVFLAILGFALLGEGLRRRQSRYETSRPGLIGRLVGLVGGRVEALAVEVAARSERFAGAVLSSLGVAVLIILGGLGWSQLQPATNAPTSGEAGTGALISRDQPWASEGGDSSGTRWVASAPASAPQVRWQAQLPDRIAGDPAISSDGTVYLGALNGELYAFGPDGSELWRATLAAAPIGAPALAADGTIYVADRSGGLTAFAPDGSERWRYQARYRPEASSGPIVGADGTIYYALVDAVQALSPSGESRWVGANFSLDFVEQAPRLSPDGTIVFLKNAAFRSSDGGELGYEIVPFDPSFNEPEYLIGANGRLYYRSAHQMIGWRVVEEGIAVTPGITWNFAGSTVVLPTDAGVTPSGVVWFVYSSDFADTRIVWINPDGSLAGSIFQPYRNYRAVAVSSDGTIHGCGQTRNGQITCLAFAPGNEGPRWEVDLEANGELVGGALVDGLLYLSLDSGQLIVLGS